MLKHLVKELPFLQKEMAEKLKTTVAAIKKLGDKRETFEEQRAVLTQVSMELHDIIKCAIRDHYVGAFFDPIHTDLAVEGPQNIRRLRAAIQHLNIRVANKQVSGAQKVQLDLLDYLLWFSSYFNRYNSYP